jgi:hypothetical protein
LKEKLTDKLLAKAMNEQGVTPEDLEMMED